MALQLLQMVAVKIRSTVVKIFFSSPPVPVDFAIGSCGFGDAIPNFTATRKRNKPGYVSSKRKHLLLVVVLCVCPVGMLV